MPDLVYVVQKGDYLTTIANRFLGNPARYIEIYNYNIGTLKSGNPDLIYPGEVILIPPEIKIEKPVIPPILAEPNEAVIEINGNQFYGWEDVSINRNMETAADSFSFSAVFEPDKLPIIKPFQYDKCKISIGKNLIITGRIEKVSPSIDKGGVKLGISGRSLAGQLIDVSVLPPFEFTNQTIMQIAKKICQPYGIGAESDIDTGGQFEKAVADHGQSVFDFLNKLATQRGLLITSAPNGNIRFIRANKNGKPILAIEEGEKNFEGASGDYDGTSRYSSIILDGQSREGGGNKQGKADDVEIKNTGINRTLITQPPETPEASDLNTMAKWEISKRKALSQPLEVNLSSWIYGDDNSVFEENEIVIVKIPSCYIAEEKRMIIKNVSFSRSNSGTGCKLSLIDTEAYGI